jgi:hypothetical protein
MSDKTKKEIADSKIVSDMLRDFKLSADAEAENRKRALFILDFIRPGSKQFSDSQIAARGNRPSYSFNQLPKFGRQVINDQWQNVPQIKYVPKNDATVDKAEVLEDKIREVQAQGCAQTAYKLAIANQINMGWAYFAFGTEYEGDETNDQNIYIRQIPNPFLVYDDPATREQDRSDRRFLIEVEDIPRTEFNDANEKDYTESELVSIGSDYPEWATMGKDLVRIGHYWRVEHDKSTVWFDKESGVKVLEKPDDIDAYNEREIKKPRIMYYKCTATEVLEKREWIGSYIPYCFVEGNKSIVDGKTYYTGLYEDMVSTQVLYNYATNTAIELAESAPISPFIGDSRAFKGYEKYYDQANTKNYSYLPFNAIDENGNPIPAPQRMQNGADLGSAVSLIQMAEQNFYGTSGIYPASLGQQSNEKSGKAIMARQKEGDISTSNYADCFGRALQFGGMIFKDLAKKVYDGAREIRVMSEDKKTRSVKINQSYRDEKTGKPMRHDLTKGDYEVVVTTGPSYSTKREEAREAQIQLFQAAPQAMLPALPMIIRNMDWPGADKTADAVERGLPPELRDPEQMQGAMKDVPPVILQQMQQAQQIIQQLGEKLQEAQAVANDKQAEQQLKVGELQLKAQSAQTQAEKDQADAALKAAELQFEREKLATESALEAQRIELEKIKYMAELQKQPNPEPIQQESDDVMVGKLGVNALQGYALDKQSEQEQEAQREAMELDIKTKELMVQQQSVAVQEQGISIQQQNMAMLLDMLGAMKGSFDNLSADIRAPKKVVRDANGQASGVITVV